MGGWRDHYAIERKMYGDRVADGMEIGDIYETITGCGEVVRENPIRDAEGIYWAIRFMAALAQGET